jgi:hypothetical protein
MATEAKENPEQGASLSLLFSVSHTVFLVIDQKLQPKFLQGGVLRARTKIDLPDLPRNIQIQAHMF